MKILSSTALSPADVQNLRKLSGLCQNHDHISLSFPLGESSASTLTQYYLIYQKDILTSALARTHHENTGYECIAFTQPGFRRQGRFHALLTEAITDLPEEEPLILVTDAKGTAARKALKALECEYWYSEYMMKIDLPHCQNKAAQNKIPANFTISETNLDSAADSITTYQLLLAQKTIGSCYIARHQKDYYLYGFEISPEFRNQGHGRTFLNIICSKLSGHEKSMPLILQVNSQNENACHLYKSFGFQITEELQYYLW